MARSLKGRGFHLASLACAVAPFAAGAIRALRADDFRMLWMAVGAAVGAAAVAAVFMPRGQTPPVGRLAAATLVVATAGAGTVAYALGARAAFGIWAVALVFGLCWSASRVLGAWAGPTQTRSEPRDER